MEIPALHQPTKTTKTIALPIRSLDRWVSLCRTILARSKPNKAIRYNAHVSAYPLYTNLQRQLQELRKLQFLKRLGS